MHSTAPFDLHISASFLCSVAVLPQWLELQVFYFCVQRQLASLSLVQALLVCLLSSDLIFFVAVIFRVVLVNLVEFSVFFSCNV